MSSDCEDHAGSNEGNGMSSPPTVEGTEASAESNSPSRRPNLAQDTERAADQTRKSKLHSKTKDKDWLGPLVLMLKGPGLKTVLLNQLLRRRKENQPASLVNIQRLIMQELGTVTTNFTAVTIGQKKGEKSFVLKGLGLDLIVQSQVIQSLAHMAVTRSRPVPLTITQIMAVRIHKDIVVAVAGLAPVPDQASCQALTQKMW